MATATATTFCPLSATIASPKKSPPRRVHFLTGMNSFSGLKAQNGVVSLSLPLSTEQSFAKIVSSLRAPTKSRGRRGGAGASTCNAAEEIFRIAAIMNGLVLIGVAVGFVLLRVEAFVEESEI